MNKIYFNVLVHFGLISTVYCVNVTWDNVMLVHGVTEDTEAQIRYTEEDITQLLLNGTDYEQLKLKFQEALLDTLKEMPNVTLNRVTVYKLETPSIRSFFALELQTSITDIEVLFQEFNKFLNGKKAIRTANGQFYSQVYFDTFTLKTDLSCYNVDLSLCECYTVFMKKYDCSWLSTTTSRTTPEELTTTAHTTTTTTTTTETTTQSTTTPSSTETTTTGTSTVTSTPNTMTTEKPTTQSETRTAEQTTTTLAQTTTTKPTTQTETTEQPTTTLIQTTAKGSSNATTRSNQSTTTTTKRTSTYSRNATTNNTSSTSNLPGTINTTTTLQSRTSTATTRERDLTTAAVISEEEGDDDDYLVYIIVPIILLLLLLLVYILFVCRLKKKKKDKQKYLMKYNRSEEEHLSIDKENRKKTITSFDPFTYNFQTPARPDYFSKVKENGNESDSSTQAMSTRIIANPIFARNGDGVTVASNGAPVDEITFKSFRNPFPGEVDRTAIRPADVDFHESFEEENIGLVKGVPNEGFEGHHVESDNETPKYLSTENMLQEKINLEHEKSSDVSEEMADVTAGIESRQGDIQMEVDSSLEENTNCLMEDEDKVSYMIPSDTTETDASPSPVTIDTEENEEDDDVLESSAPAKTAKHEGSGENLSRDGNTTDDNEVGSPSTEEKLTNKQTPNSLVMKELTTEEPLVKNTSVSELVNAFGNIEKRNQHGTKTAPKKPPKTMSLKEKTIEKGADHRPVPAKRPRSFKLI